VLGPFVYVFGTLAAEVSKGVVAYGADKGVGKSFIPYPANVEYMVSS
jgi:hypothetical protein